MQAVLFYSLYPIIVLLASLPLRVTYLISDFFYLILKTSGYRRNVVIQNLKNSFPDKSEKEINVLAEKYFRYLCDLILETLKTVRMSERETRARCTFVQLPFLPDLYAANQSFIIVMGHYGNWEWAGPCFALNNKCQLVVIYRPLSNPYFEKMLQGTRTRFGTRITPDKNTLREMVASRGSLTATALIADQSAKQDAYWTTFLNQDTAVHTGPEKLARKFNYPVVFMNVTRPKRGHYVVTPELLVSDPSTTSEGQITEIFTRRLETEIRRDPTIWLWSHRRWKHKRPVTA